MTNCSGDGSTRGGNVFSCHYSFLLSGTRGIIVFSSRYEILLFIFFYQIQIWFLRFVRPQWPLIHFLPHCIFLPHTLLFPCSPTMFTFFRMVLSTRTTICRYLIPIYIGTHTERRVGYLIFSMFILWYYYYHWSLMCCTNSKNNYPSPDVAFRTFAKISTDFTVTCSQSCFSWHLFKIQITFITVSRWKSKSLYTFNTRIYSLRAQETILVKHNLSALIPRI